MKYLLALVLLLALFISCKSEAERNERIYQEKRELINKKLDELDALGESHRAGNITDSEYVIRGNKLAAEIESMGGPRFKKHTIETIKKRDTI